MFELLSGFVTVVAAVGVAGVGYFQTKNFVGKKLRFVDQAQNPVVPIAAGVIAALVATPVAIILPFVGVGTAMIFGVAVAAGTRAGVRSFGRALYP
jgi:hypothetical protein